MISYSRLSSNFFGSLMAAGRSEHGTSFLHHLRNMKTISLGKVIKNPSQVLFQNLTFSKEYKASVCAQTFSLLHFIFYCY